MQSTKICKKTNHGVYSFLRKVPTTAHVKDIFGMRGNGVIHPSVLSLGTRWRFIAAGKRPSLGPEQFWTLWRQISLDSARNRTTISRFSNIQHYDTL